MLQKGDILTLKIVPPTGEKLGDLPPTKDNIEVIHIDKDDPIHPVGVFDHGNPYQEILWLDPNGSYTDDSGWTVNTIGVLRNGEPLPINR